MPPVEEWLLRLARAVRQCHTYPTGSPLSVDAIVSCHQGLRAFETRERLVCRISPGELIVDEIGIGTGSIIEHELARRLHRANVASVAFDRGAPLRDLTRFCEHVASWETRDHAATNLADVLLEHGVDSIAIEMAHRPEVLDLGVPRAPLVQLVQSERRRQALSAGAVSHLYPPDKGWVRVDPASHLGQVSLIDLAILVDDPTEVAAMLLRLTDDDPVRPQAREAALEQKFGDVSTLFSSMDPQLARVMFAKLARAVLNLDVDRRETLLRRTILPALLDGGPSGAVLRDFADVDLAEALCLLLDLETAAPEVLATALDRLELPAARRDNIVPLLEAQLHARQRVADPGSGQRAVDEYVRKLIRIEPAVGRSLAEFAAFDLSLDAGATAALSAVKTAISSADVALAELQCLRSLVRLEPNPLIAQALLERAVALLGELHHEVRWSDLAIELAQFGQVADALRAGHPEVADAVAAALTAFWTVERARRAADLCAAAEPAARMVATRLVESSAAAVVPAFLTIVNHGTPESTVRAIAGLLCDHAPLVAPALVADLDRCSDAAVPVLVRALGFAGPGHERAVANQLGQRDEQTDREALRALVRIGTAKAAAVVAHHLLSGPAAARGAAEEALWHFAPAHTASQLKDLLADRQFVRQHPDIAVRLLERAAQAKPAGLEPVLAGLAPFRYWFWNPRLVRVSRRARRLLAQ